VSIVDPSSFRAAGAGAGPSGGGLGPTQEEEEEDDASLRRSLLGAVTGRQAMGELQFKTGLTPAALGRLKEEFVARATDAGTLDLPAFREIMLLQFPALKEDESVIDKLFKSFDSDGTGAIEFKEFVLGASKMVRGSLKDKIDMLFGIFDTEGSGHMKSDQILRMLLAAAGEDVSEDDARAVLVNAQSPQNKGERCRGLKRLIKTANFRNSHGIFPRPRAHQSGTFAQPAARQAGIHHSQGARNGRGGCEERGGALGHGYLRS
jgi:Ca2+-binding EF-hand superfamily protein